MFTIDDIFSKGNIKNALEFLGTKNNSAGIDGVFLDDLPEYWDNNGEKILNSIKNCSYSPEIVLEVEILNYKGKRRKISRYASVDRLIMRSITQILKPVMEENMSKYSFAYQEDKGVQKAIKQAITYIEEGKRWVVEMDVNDFFGSINLEKLCEIIKTFDIDDTLFNLIHTFLFCRVEYEGDIRNIKRGLIQGNSLSPLFSNVYMNSFDKALENKGLSFCRFSDDINIYVEDELKASRVYKEVEQLLNDKHLKLQPSKCGIYSAIGRYYLGSEIIQQKNKTIIARKRRRNGDIRFNCWHKTAIQKVDRNYHLINDGIITRKDYTLLFENDSNKQFLPVETVNSLSIYSNIIFSNNFFEFMNSKRLDVALFDKFGNRVGSFRSASNSSSGRTLISQAEVYLDPIKRLDIAKKIDIASMHNIRSNLRYYNKQRSCEILKNAIECISNIIVEMNQVKELGQLLLVEARGRQAYYQTFNAITNNEEGFVFIQRTKRPPKDAINAMISFGNTFLYNRISREINRTTMDIRIGLLHSTNQRSESLNLDIAEIFKPIIVDRVIFTIINKNMIHPEHFESVSNGGVYLTKETNYE